MRAASARGKIGALRDRLADRRDPVRALSLLCDRLYAEVAALGEEARMIEDGNPRALIDIVRDEKVDVLIAGGRNMYTALKARIPFLDINQEREFGYAGYSGMVELARQLVLTIDSPVWQSVRQPAPWQRQQRVVEPLDTHGEMPTPEPPTATNVEHSAEA